jgi:hypothetical protein
MTDPRGPIRKILAVEVPTAENNHGYTVLTLSCGHKANANPIFSHSVGEDRNCLLCKLEVKKAAAPQAFTRQILSMLK